MIPNFQKSGKLCTEYAHLGDCYDIVTFMEDNDEYDKELDRLHEKLARIYRLGALTRGEIIATQGLWARIERLMATQVAVQVREAKRFAAAYKTELETALGKVSYVNKEKS